MMNKTAIILFAESPDIEARKKQFCHISSFLTSKKISTVLSSHITNLASQCNRDFYWLDSLKQHGNSFGEKIANAFEDIFNMGYEHVICIGNDTIQLNHSHLSAAIDAVEHQKVILGPSQDGGAYLIGFSKKYFNPSSFKEIKWQSSCTYQNLKKAFSEEDLVETEILEDFDDESSLKKLPNSSILLLIKTIINAFKNISIAVTYPQDEIFLLNHKDLRAPPATAF